MRHQIITELFQQHADALALLIRRWFKTSADDVATKILEQSDVRIEGNRIYFRWALSDRDDDAITLAMTAFANLIKSRNVELLRSRYNTLTLAIHNHHSAFSKMPGHRSVRGVDLNPGLSWRVHLLPFIDGGQYVDLFQRFKLDEPWDSPNNKPLIKEMPEVFRPIPHNSEAAEMKQGLTTIQAPVSPGAALGADGAESFRGMIDGLSNTVFLVEVEPEHAVKWTAPDDYEYDPDEPTAGLQQIDDQIVVAFGDGASRQLKAKQLDGTWNALFTCDGEESLVSFWDGLEID